MLVWVATLDGQTWAIPFLTVYFELLALELNLWIFLWLPINWCITMRFFHTVPLVSPSLDWTHPRVACPCSWTSSSLCAWPSQRASSFRLPSEALPSCSAVLAVLPPLSCPWVRSAPWTSHDEPGSPGQAASSCTPNCSLSAAAKMKRSETAPEFASFCLLLPDQHSVIAVKSK